ncbi:lanthionine synthetase [Dactylosporangium vinaceum]|uniref:Lanthionine synthetase LanC family protein n=1 Tax=Dactylosporangium vinaceum TaxID=53362 RepID=A0ABV5MRS5_9ACTN|nr:lanthionine synthetase LanC family protein [Dactylosporangium vinaceum]UAC00375.1 lanthionine synthetase [Dactylosporangium vinaceum]
MTYRTLGESAWAWVLDQVQDSDGPWLPVSVPGALAGDRDSLYAGIAGLAPVLAEIRQYRAPTARESALAEAIVARLAREAATRTDVSLFDGLAGDATALRLLDPGRVPALDVAPPEYHDIISGTAGVLLTQSWLGVDTGTLPDALVAGAEPAPGGLDWRMKPGYRSSSPNYSHGTAGVATALALTGRVDAAVQGVSHLLAIADLSGGGFVLEHTIPRSTREVEPVTYTWCHGPAGTSHVFAALAHAGVESVGGYAVDDLRRRCLHSTLSSGIPERLRPGFWDNDGRCCGTAGVGDILLDAYQSLGDERYLDGARRMGDALVERAVDGRYWRFVEYRSEEPLLPPGTGWMQGAAGIAAFLLRLERVLDRGPSAPIVDRPDNWFAVPAGLRVTTASADRSA